MKNRGLPLFLFGYLFLLFPSYRFIFGIILTYCWVITYEKESLLLLWLFFFAIIIQTPRTPTEITRGTIVEVHSNSAIVQHNQTRVLISPCSECVLDDVVEIKGTLKEIESAPTTFGFQFSAWTKENNIDFSMYLQSLKIVEKGKTPRSVIQRKILQETTEEERNFLMKLIFNIHQNNDEFPFLQELGFGLYGFLTLSRKLLSLKLYPRKVQKVDFFLSSLAAFFYQFSFLATRLLISSALRLIPLSSKDRVGCFGFLCWLFFPEKLTSLSFIIPFGFRLIAQLPLNHKRIVNYNFVLIIQSFFFNQVTPLVVFFYPVIFKGMGFFYLLAWIEVGIPKVNGGKIFNSFIPILEYLYSFHLVGNFLGFGLIFFLLLQMVQKRKKALFFLVSFLLFLYGGLFHPLTEVTFIQIGQGDSILIRSPFRNQVILIDTGKKNQYSLLLAALKARGITTIDTLIITHEDEDHQGGTENLLQDFDVLEIVKSPKDIIKNGIVLKAVHQNLTADKNDNSLIYYFEINGIRFLMTGDISTQVEEQLIRSNALIEADVLKLAHHGASTSTSLSFLEVIDPQVAVSSNGLNNSFHHPSPKIVERLKNEKILHFLTQKEGDISFYFTPFLNFVTTTSKKIGIIKKVIR